ncbi:MAG: hypothetical protein GWP06_00275 [Actinobacteria bacterium]|nr:hypothetical protein [Actinomycetota bacterium]
MPKTILLSGTVGFEINVEDISAELESAGGEDVTFNLTTGGGSVFQGLAISNLIKNYSGKTTMHIIGLAASMGTKIALAADKVTAEEDAVFMIHNPTGFVHGDQNDMAKMSKTLESIADLLARTYAQKTGLTKAEHRKQMDNETFFFGDEIKDAGFADQITGAKKDKRHKAAALSDAELDIKSASETLKTLEIEEDYTKIAALLNEGKNMPNIKAGESLGAFLNREIDRKAGGDQDERQSIISNMARGAGISVSTVNQILTGSIICPPISRLRAFARVLSLTISRIISAAEKDGCNYNEEEGVMSCDIKTQQATEPVKHSAKRSSAETENPNGDKKMSLDTFLAENAAEKIVYDQRLKDAKAEGKTEGIAEKQADIDRVHPLISAEGASDALIKSGFEALKGVTSIDTFVGIASYETRQKEAFAALDADGEVVDDITAEGNKAAGDGKIIKNQADLDAEKELFNKMKGKEKKEA